MLPCTITGPSTVLAQGSFMLVVKSRKRVHEADKGSTSIAGLRVAIFVRKKNVGIQPTV